MFSAVKRGRLSRGFPEWEVVGNWLDPAVRASYPDQERTVKCELKNTELQILDSYEGNAPDAFWEKFPKRALPKSVKSKVNVLKLRRLILKASDKMTRSERKRANKIVKDLRVGADAYQRSELPPITSRNAKSAYEHGALLTDTIATWVNKGFVAGPFDTPPLPGFRENPLGAVERNGKVRPILNMSGPAGSSFNDNVKEEELERLHMGTAKQFSYLLRRAGRNAKFSKFDIKDAYKLIPAKVEDYRLQGFKWLNKYFVEVMMSFGGKPSPCNFDRLGKTKDLLACIRSGVPRYLVPRALDDSPCVAPENTGLVERFTAEMKIVCEEINIPLAEKCPLAEKAFELVTKGTVLGVGFDSEEMKWFLSKEKAEKVVRRCLDGVISVHMDLNQVQKLMGSVNDLAQMCPPMKFHKRSGNAFLKSFGGNMNILKFVPGKFKEDLAVMAKMAENTICGLPIADKPVKPPLWPLVFYTDAAGASFAVVRGERVYHSNEGKGVACICGSGFQDIWAWTRLQWPEGLLTGKVDEKGCSFGSKTTTLESVGLLLPLLAFPESLAGKHLVFKIDNMAVVWGWESGYVKNDETASEILKTISYLAGYLGATVHVEHVNRMSEDLAKLADEMSRRSESRDAVSRLVLEKALFREVTGFLNRWLVDPGRIGNLCIELLQELKMKFPV